jgi:hypothetical protein
LYIFDRTHDYMVARSRFDNEVFIRIRCFWHMVDDK